MGWSLTQSHNKMQPRTVSFEQQECYHTGLRFRNGVMDSNLYWGYPFEIAVILPRFQWLDRIHQTIGSNRRLHSKDRDVSSNNKKKGGR